MANSRAIARGSVRVVAGVIGVGVAVVVLVGAAVVPLPGFRMTPPAQTVTPVPADQLRVCPGGLLEVGTPGNASSLSSLGSPSTVTEATTSIAQRSLATPSVRGGGGAPQAVSTQSGGAKDRALIAGSQSQKATASDIAGLAAAACGEATSDSWLVAGSTTLGSTSLVMLNNPTGVDATVNLAVYTEGGRVDSAGANGLVVRANSQLVVPLTGIVPNAQVAVVNVQASGGSVYATMQQSSVAGLSPQGVELVGPTAEPSTRLVVPGMTVANTGKGGGTDGGTAQLPSVRLLAPGTAAAHVTVTATSDTTAGVDATARITVQGGTVREVPLEHLIDGSYTVRITSDRPVVAAARAVDVVASSNANQSETARAEAASQDFAWFVATNPLQASALFTVPAGPSAALHLVNDAAKDATVTVDERGGSSRTVAVPAGTAVAVGVSPDTSYTLDGVGGLRASVSLTGNGQSSSYGLNPPGPLAQPITVYPK